MTARVIIFVFISVISSPLQQSIGSVRTYQLGVATWPLSVVFFPVLNLMARSETYGENNALFWLVFFDSYSIAHITYITLSLYAKRPTFDSLSQQALVEVVDLWPF